MIAADARLILVFTSDGYSPPDLLRGIRSVTGDVPLIGSSTAGEITAAGPAESSVVVVALGGAGFTVATADASVKSGSQEAGAQVARALNLIDAPNKILLMLVDSVSAYHHAVVRGAYSQAGAAVRLVGGCAAEGGLRSSRAFTLRDGRSFERSVVAAAIGSTGPFGIGVRHGWSRVGEPMAITRDDHNRVALLDDEPALDRYLDRLEAPAEVYRDAEAFTRFIQTRPLGLLRREGEANVRHVGDPNFEDRTLGGQVIDIAEGGLIWVMEGDARSICDAADLACTDALAGLEGRPPLGLVVVDCAARKSILGDYLGPEIDKIAGHAAGSPVAGFYSYGEIARTRGPSGYHQETLVVLALG